MAGLVDPVRMVIDAVATALLLVFAAVGWLRGALASGLALLGLVAAYGAAFGLAPLLAPALAADLGVSRLVALPLAGTAAFVGTYATVGALAWSARLLEQRRRGDRRRGRLDRLSGACFGAVRGLAVALLVGWLALWVDALRLVGEARWAPDAQSSWVAQASGQLVEAGAGTVLGGNGDAGRVVARLAGEPAQTLERFRALTRNRRVEALRDDAVFWKYVEAGDADAALDRLSFAAIAYDASLRRDFGALGLVSDAAVADPIAFRREARRALEQIAPRLRALRHDPELARLRQDPEVQALAASGDTLGLLRQRGVQDLVHRVLAAAPSPSSATGP